MSNIVCSPVYWGMKTISWFSLGWEGGEGKYKHAMEKTNGQTAKDPPAHLPKQISNGCPLKPVCRN